MKKKTNYNYYDAQLAEMAKRSSIASIKIMAQNASTNWMDINKESAPKIIEFLKQFVENQSIEAQPK